VFDFIEMFYTSKRNLVRNGMESHVEFERQPILTTEDVEKTPGYSEASSENPPVIGKTGNPRHTRFGNCNT